MTEAGRCALEVDGSVIIDRLGSGRLFADIGLPGGENGGGGENNNIKLEFFSMSHS